MFHDLSSPGAQAFFTQPDDPGVALDNVAQLVWTMGCTGKFLWPIPYRGLRKRLHRITSPTLVVCGEQDALIPVALAHEFARLISGSQLVLVANCGHIPQVEQPTITIAAVRKFLGSRSRLRRETSHHVVGHLRHGGVGETEHPVGGADGDYFTATVEWPADEHDGVAVARLGE
jgi:alpha/beta hydrolase fold